MDPKTFVSSALLLLVVAAASVALFRKVGLGSILGLLVAGILIGPYTPGPSATGHPEDLRHFTELGVVLLLFLIGLEMHPQRLWALRRTLFGLGSLQILVSGLLIAAWFRLFEPDWERALLFGFVLSLSSTALVMQMLHERSEVATIHGQTAFSVLLMQDLAVVPLIALLPVLAHTEAASAGGSVIVQIGSAAGMLALVLLGGRYAVPAVLDWLARNHNREAFVLVVMTAVFVAAWAMDQANMSMALGAFLMGVMLSSSRYSVQIEAIVEPHKGLLMSLFFIAIGMSIDPGVVAERPGLFVLGVLGILVIKVVVLLGLCLLFGTGLAVAVRVSFVLAQAGEFGFVVFGAANALGIIDQRQFMTMVAVISLTMLLTPLLTGLAQAITRRLPAAAAAVHASLAYAPEESPGAKVVIGGYGRVGHAMGIILQQHGIAYLAFESDAELVASWRNEGHPVYYGDIGDPHLLDVVDFTAVALVVLTIDNKAAAIRATRLIRAHAQTVPIIARARDLTTCDALARAGATHAFPETLEATLRLAAVTLRALGVATDEVDRLLANVRNSDYALLDPEQGK
ncbi:cation:proton antiporter [uncultured Thiodictyon sp.]|uniref:cation:proton antiporter domain-containing protein n=1 Tax=uncultured Thiodictyon sp. TaxID=1846217 RepID=UPI0025D50912|nr:cation:proton antiporter [uncultured Thiodictyon sp.]